MRPHNHSFQNGELNAVVAHKDTVIAAGCCSLPFSISAVIPLIENWVPALPGLTYTKQVPIISNSAGPTQGRLNGTSSDGSGGFWVVGFIGTPIPTLNIFRTLIYHRQNNGPFYYVPSPNIDGLIYLDNRLSSVSSISSHHAWAVGQYWPISDGTPRSLIIGWDGHIWINYPALPVRDSDSLFGVVSITPDDGWAVGSSWDKSLFKNYTLIEHWDGEKWSIIPSPNSNLLNNQLQAICAISANDLWAVGYSYDTGPAMETLIMRNQGNGWELAKTFRGCLYGVSASATDDVWAVGCYNKTGLMLPLILHYDGNKWSEIPAPPIASTSVQLNSVSAVSATEAWAVGRKYIGPSFVTLALRWNGKKWSEFPSQ